ncbi:hypothetical protein NCC49_001737 [Naganishia albida]|nr:hypothetical protein NCC49_001737 [Naganishia albida]
MASHFQDAIVLFGDSLTQAWSEGSLAHLMSQVYMRKMDVLNRGFGGYTTEWCLPLFKKIFAKKDAQAGLPPVKLVTILFGANDATLPPCAQSLPLEKYIANMNYYVSSLVEPESDYYQPEARIVLITPPPLVQSMRLEMPLPPGIPKEEQGKERNLDHTRKFKDACLTIGEEWKARTNGRVQVIDYWKVIVDAAGSEQDSDLRPFFTDGLHLTPPGYRLLFDELMQVIHSAGWDDLNPNAMKMTVPRWADIDPSNPTAALKEKAAAHIRNEL